MVTLDETVRRLAADRDVLMDRTADRTEEELSAGYRVRPEPIRRGAVVGAGRSTGREVTVDGRAGAARHDRPGS
ncbi:hypothetical protein DLJ59_05925 [Micromonospora inaquosa]|uniref:Uncharacterized protein n=1 Tax=Micromonospora inaquosa TaxID=2203716 RepID=A0A3N9WZ39_9ACTN|nr:hypothetical protein DLJ59_05925 [Micromonospora inaquosa]